MARTISKAKIVGVKELRLNLQKYIDKVRQGESFTVVRRSKPVFKITPTEDENLWEPVIDFTEIKRGGVPLKELLFRL
ncbi:MAG: type II toxin-antitoxin system prevent-host-death family antitoxin [Candidatus Colwellbacteria bacterium]